MRRAQDKCFLKNIRVTNENKRMRSTQTADNGWQTSI